MTRHVGDAKRPAVRIGRAAARKLLAVEGIRLSAASERMFRDFDRRGLSDAARMREILAKHRAQG